MSRTVCVVITARASYARIKTALKAIKDHPGLNLDLVVSASAVLDRYGDASTLIEKDGFRISSRVFSVVEGENPLTSAKTAGLSLIELATCFDKIKPDIVVSVADRYETLSTAIAASYMNIPLVHIQGGEITGSIDEKVRHAKTKLADFHFVSTDNAYENVRRMGERADTIFNTGCPSLDIAKQIVDEKNQQINWSEKFGGVGPNLDGEKTYMVALQHPVTTEYESSFENTYNTLKAVYESKIPAYWFWPNIDAGSDATSKAIRVFRERHNSAKIHFFKNLSPENFLRLVKNSCVLVGNSSVGIRECSFIGTPVVNIGSRQMGRQHSQNVVHAGYHFDEILCKIRQQVENGAYAQSDIYGDGTAGKKIADTLAKIELTVEKRLTY